MVVVVVVVVESREAGKNTTDSIESLYCFRATNPRTNDSPSSR